MELALKIITSVMKMDKYKARYFLEYKDKFLFVLTYNAVDEHHIRIAHKSSISRHWTHTKALKTRFNNVTKIDLGRSFRVRGGEFL